MEQVNCPRSQTLGVGCGKLCGPSNGRIHVRIHVEQSSVSDQVFQASKCSITLAGNMLALAG